MTTFQENRTNSHLRALSACFENALSVLRIASRDFRELSVLVRMHILAYLPIYTILPPQRYGQETTTVMTAYSAIFLLKVTLSKFSDTTMAHRFLVVAELRCGRPAIRVARGCRA